ncbi:coproporphyrinogen III oxidase [Hymenobacter armeniacus]|uniref:coproporphyrinogen oxidase n=1 Tax=Hymenobacter armeniacus TaxID=2771358 RepID=A0ABR8JR59_9BACT|nr:coproporphyrinogen III oxidase [Hymenobacter armeniacus]MBD2721052.1 coproporphyrinogen III oxidase [Hymenobacter armeniacus]
MKSNVIPPSAFRPRAGAADWMRQFQDWLCHRLETADGGGSRFRHEEWTHPGGGGGLARALQHGAVLEKGSVIFSEVWDEMSEPLVKQLQLNDRSYFATGITAGLHPRSPMVPISHLSLRYFEARTGEAWFAGSLDLTPVYVDVAQARWFHAQIQAVCNRHDAGYYARFKAEADEHFYLPHRGETRGVGGLHFPQLRVGPDGLFEELLAFVQDVGEVYGRTYCTLMGQNAHLAYSEPEKRWQQVRRARCAEFTLATGHPGRFEPATGYPEGMVLGLPPRAEWHYNHAPTPGSPEAQTQQWLRRGVDWLAPNNPAVGP